MVQWRRAARRAARGAYTFRPAVLLKHFGVPFGVKVQVQVQVQVQTALLVGGSLQQAAQVLGALSSGSLHCKWAVRRSLRRCSGRARY